MVRLTSRQWLLFYRRHARRYWRGSASLAPRLGTLARLRHILEGFHPAEADWYGQAGVDRRLCLSNAHRETVLHGLNGRHAVYLDDKLVFAQAMECAGLPHPQVFGHAHGGRWHWRGGGPDAFARSIAAEGLGVVKPIRGRKGETVRFVRRWEEACPPWRDDLIATRFVRQADYAAAIFPDSLNTIRVVTVNVGEGPYILAAAHRFGGAGTGGVDNFSAGGVVARIDTATGRMGRAFRVGPDNRLEWLERHPDTGAPIAGRQVPGWKRVVDLAHALCAALPFLPYVGWDIAITPDGPLVVEGNAHPSLRFFEVYGPLMADPEAARQVRALARHRPAR